MKRNKVLLESDNLDLVGEVYYPEAVDEPYPAICLCHGIPLGQQHSPGDSGYPGLAQRLCDAGFVTLIFNFRGTGQSQGNLDMLGWTRDLEAAIDFLSSLDEVDKSRLCLLGSSGGAAVSVYVAANDTRVSSVKPVMVRPMASGRTATPMQTTTLLQCSCRDIRVRFQNVVPVIPVIWVMISMVRMVCML